MIPRDEFQPGGDQANADTGRQGTDKDPAEENGKKEKVTTKDLKGKKVDADPEEEEKKSPTDQNQ